MEIFNVRIPEALHAILPVSKLLTRLELVTSSLPRMRTTDCAISAFRRSAVFAARQRTKSYQTSYPLSRKLFMSAQQKFPKNPPDFFEDI